MNFKKASSDAIISLMGEGVEIVGEVSFTQGVKIDGVIKGNVKSDASLVVGSKGTIHASERVEILKEGKVFGDLYTPCLIIEAGAVFEGKCNMSERKAEEGALLKVVEPSADGAKAAGNDKPWTMRNE